MKSCVVHDNHTAGFNRGQQQGFKPKVDVSAGDKMKEKAEEKM